MTLQRRCLFAASAWTGGSRTIALGFAGVLCGAATTLVLLRDLASAGRPAAGLVGQWCLAVLAGGRALRGRACLSASERRRRARALNLAVPLLFGAVVFYLWEVLVRGFRRTAGADALRRSAAALASYRRCRSSHRTSSRPLFAAY